MMNKPDKPVVYFNVLQSVEDHLEKSGKFRPQCAFLKISENVSRGIDTVYIPCCDKKRFDFGPTLNDYRANAIFTPLERGKPWSIPDFVVFGEHFHDIHCPPSCKGYRNKRIVAFLNKFRPHANAVKQAPVPTFITPGVALLVTALVAIVCVVLGWMTPEGRRWLHLDKPQEQHAPNPSVPQTTPHPDTIPPRPKPEQIKTSPTDYPNKQTKKPRKPESQEQKPPLVSAPNGIAIGGGNVINPTVNNFGPIPPTVSFELFDRPPLPEAAPQQWIRISINKTFLDPKFAIICDRPCKALSAGIILGLGGGIAQVNWGKIPDRDDIAAISVNQPNPMPSDAKVEAVVASEDDRPVKILSVRSLTIDPKKQ